MFDSFLVFVYFTKYLSIVYMVAHFVWDQQIIEYNINVPTPHNRKYMLTQISTYIFLSTPSNSIQF